jgi:hypothetical protein
MGVEGHGAVQRHRAFIGVAVGSDFDGPPNAVDRTADLGEQFAGHLQGARRYSDSERV